MCNLFENGSSSEWLLYISEWTAPHTTSPLSNIRVTTKVAVTALLSDNPLLQDRGSAIIYNLAIKEVKTVVGIQFQFYSTIFPPAADHLLYFGLCQILLIMSILPFFFPSERLCI
jgi:hypothetical protein